MVISEKNFNIFINKSKVVQHTYYRHAIQAHLCQISNLLD